MKTRNLLQVLGMMAMACVMAGCASTGVVSGQLNRERPLTTRLEADDYRQVIEAVVDEMLVDPGVTEWSQNRRPVLDVTSVRLGPGVRQQIDTGLLTNSMRSKLLRSRRFRFVDRSTMADDLDMINLQNEMGLTDPGKAVQAGRQSAAEAIINGTISEVRTKVGRKDDSYYVFTLNLKDLTTGELVWSGEKQIRKMGTKPLLGL